MLGECTHSPAWLTRQTGVDFTDPGHLGHPQVIYNSGLCILENRSLRILLVVCGVKPSKIVFRNGGLVSPITIGLYSSVTASRL